MSSGIGRGLKSSAQQDDIFVFGYACKLFRDDSKAQFVDRGGTLIPWMGDPNQPIDRYDGRATIYNLEPFEASKDNPQPMDYLTSDEIAIEEMCEEERYRSLRLEEDFVDPEKEEGKGSAAIGFTYDQQIEQPNTHSTLQPTNFVEHEPEPPSLRTLANVLEKTAEFIAKNGAQMEILMRAKEAGNLKFQFLNPDNPYHPIYKQVLEKKRQRNKNPYLYSLQNTSQVELTLEEVEASLRQLTRNLPSAAPNPITASEGTSASNNSGSSAYSKLVEKIREKKAEAAAKAAAETSLTPIGSAGPSESSTPIPSPPAQLLVAEEIKLPADSSNLKQGGVVDDETNDDSVIQVIPPPLDTQILIDKTASWVCKQNLQTGNEKSGIDKLAVVKKLHKDKFDFLFPDSKYNTYYLYKVALYTEMMSENKVKENKHQTNNSGSVIDPSSANQQVTNNQSNTISEDGKQMAELTVKTFPILKGFFNT